jgi:hypothetical protein
MKLFKILSHIVLLLGLTYFKHVLPQSQSKQELFKKISFARNGVIKSYDMGTYLQWEVSRLHDGQPFLFFNNVTGMRAIICLSPKSGTTKLKFLLRKGDCK